MAEITKSTEAKKDEMQVEKEKLESVKKADAAVKTMHDFTSPEVLYEELINSVRKYHPSTDISMIEKAYRVASEAHEGQKRKSGEPYIIHPLCVAIILADLELDKETIVAGLLHDAVEDTWMTYEEVEKEFGSEVALLVDGVTKLGQLSYSADKVEVQAICERCSLPWQKTSGLSLSSWQTVSTICVLCSICALRNSRRKPEKPWTSMLPLPCVWVYPRSR